MQRLRSVCFGLLGISLVVLSGCGGKDTKQAQTVPVSGTVMYKGKAVPGVKVTFMAEGASRAATGITDDNGKFQLSTFGANDGAVVGTHTVTVMKPVAGADADPTPTDDPDALVNMYRESEKKSKKEKSPIPLKYADAKTSGLKETVSDSGENTFVIQLAD